MPLDDFLRLNTAKLAKAGIDSARLDCLILLEDELGKDRSWLLAHADTSLTDVQLDRLDAKILQRLQYFPLAYIRGRSEFYGRTFLVNEHVLEPRPETEDIITILKGLDLPSAPTITDVGTGSGALAITAKLELPAANVYGTDVDTACLKTASYNANKLMADVTFVQCDLLRPLETDFKITPDVLLANLPYVPDSYHINAAATHEPTLAIFGGPDGLDLFRRMFMQINELDDKPEHIITEALPATHDALASIAASHGYSLAFTSSFVQSFTLQ